MFPASNLKTQALGLIQRAIELVDQSIKDKNVVITDCESTFSD
jgi:hypothetical protein